MAPQCEVCLVPYDLDLHRPKILSCGHTICLACTNNSSLLLAKRKCPTCDKDLTIEPNGLLPDNIFIIRMLETADSDGAPPRKAPRMEDARVQVHLQVLQRGVDAGRQLVQVLRQVVPMAVEALNHQLDTSVAQLRQMERDLEKLQRGATGDAATAADFSEQQLQQLEDSLRLLNLNKCAVVAEEGVATWKASVQLGRVSNVLRLLLLQLRAEGQLEKVADAAVPALPAADAGKPKLSILSIDDQQDLDDGRLDVNLVLQVGRRCENIRILKNLTGLGSEKLLRVVSPQLEELEILDAVKPRAVMEEVERMTSLKRLLVTFDEDMCDDVPDLPLQLEALAVTYPRENQLRCVERMSRLHSLNVSLYCGPPVAFPPSQHGVLQWLGVSFKVAHKDTMLSLIRAHRSSLLELEIFCGVSEADHGDFYFPDLGASLAECGLRALRRLVLERPSPALPCKDVDACLLQRRTLQCSLNSSVDVICQMCNTYSQIVTARAKNLKHIIKRHNATP